MKNEQNYIPTPEELFPNIIGKDIKFPISDMIAAWEERTRNYDDLTRIQTLNLLLAKSIPDHGI